MLGGHRQVLCEAKVDKLDLRCVLINHDVLSLQVSEDYLELVQIVEEDEQERLLLEQEDAEFARQLALLEKEQRKGRKEQMKIEDKIKSLAALD